MASTQNPYRPPAASPGTYFPHRSYVRYFVLAWLCAAATLAYVQRNSIAVAEEAMRNDVGLSKQQMGDVIAAFFFGYAVLQLPAGWLVDRWGSRRVLSLFAVVWSAATGAMALCQGYASLTVTRFGMGAAQACVFPACTKAIARWFPASHRAFPSGALGSFMSFGGGLGAMLTGLLIVRLGWRWLFVLFAVPGLAWGIVFYLWFRDRPEGHRSVSDAELSLIHGNTPPVRDDADSLDRASSGTNSPTRDKPAAEPTPWLAMLGSLAMWGICWQQFFRAAAYILYGSWFATYLKEVHHVTDKGAGFLTSMPLWSIIPGGLIGGLVCDWILKRTGSLRASRSGVAGASMATAAVLVAAAYFLHNVYAAVAVISLSSFCASFAGPCAYTITIDMGRRHVATVFSLMNTAGNVGAMVMPKVVPWLVDSTGRWDLVLPLVAGIYVAAFFCWLIVDPTKNFVRESD